MKKDIPLKLSVFLYALLNLIYYFLPIKLLFYASVFCLAYIFIDSMIHLPLSSRMVILGLFLCSAALLFYSRASLDDWLTGIGKNGLLVSLFTFGPLLYLPFTYEDYQSELINVAKLYMHTLLPFAFLIAIPTHFFAALTGFAAFSIIYNLFLNTSKLYGAEDVFISTLGRSYSTSGFWGTSWVSVMLVVSELHIAWYKLILAGFAFTAVSIAINLCAIKIRLLRNPGKYPVLSPDKSTVVDWRKIAMMTSLALGIVLTTLIVNLTLKWNLLAIVPLVSIFFPLVMALAQRKTGVLKRGVVQFAQKSLYKGRMEACLFTIAGLLAYAMEISGVGDMIPKLIPAAVIDYPYFTVLIVMLLIIVPGQLGLHPVAVGTTLVATINPASIGLTTPIFALAVISAWLLSNMLSPFSALNLTLAGLSGKSTWYTGLKLNWRYAIVCAFTYGALIFAIGPLLG